MSEAQADTGRTTITLAVLTAAIGAGFTGAAQAGYVGTGAGAGLPVTFDLAGPASSKSFDLNADGIPDYTVSVTPGSAITINGGTNKVSTFAGYASPFASLADFVPPHSLKTSSGAVPIATLSSGNIVTDYSSGTTEFLETLFPAPGHPGSELIGYIEGSLDITGPSGSQDAILTVTDIGYNTTPVPEPEVPGAACRWSDRPSGVSPPPGRIARLTRRVLLVGLDGATWSALHRLIDARTLPHIARLVETGMSGKLECPALPAPMLWASIATGVPADAHGIGHTLEVRPDYGGVQPVSARSWRAPPVWQMLAAAGVPTTVIGWPASWPADAWPGIAVDDRFAQPAAFAQHDWPLPPRCITPVRLRATLRELRVHPGELDASVRGTLLASALAVAVSVHSAATYLAENECWEFLAVHYDLLAQDGSDAAYRFQDAMLGRLLGLAGPDAEAIIASPQGVLIASGPSFAADAITHGAGVTDIVPMVLARFGLTTQGARARPRPPAVTPSEPGASAGPEAARLIAQVERTTLLNQASAALSAGDHSAAAVPLEYIVARYPDDPEACFLLGQCRFFLGDWEACLGLARRVAAAAPHSPWGEMMVGAALALGGDAEAAAPHLQAARRLAGQDPAAHIRLGAIALHLGKPRDAQVHYAHALSIDATAADARAGIGLALLAQGDTAGAEAQLRAALGVRFHAPALHQQLGVMLAAQGRWSEAAIALRTALTQHAELSGAASLLRRVEVGAACDAPSPDPSRKGRGTRPRATPPPHPASGGEG